jgi:hypothetical protein
MMMMMMKTASRSAAIDVVMSVDCGDAARDQGN